MCAIIEAIVNETNKLSLNYSDMWNNEGYCYQNKSQKIIKSVIIRKLWVTWFKHLFWMPLVSSWSNNYFHKLLHFSSGPHTLSSYCCLSQSLFFLHFFLCLQLQEKMIHPWLNKTPITFQHCRYKQAQLSSDQCPEGLVWLSFDKLRWA